MSNMPELKIGVVAVSRDCFPESLSVNRRKALIDAYTKKYGEGTVYECPICIVESEIHMVQALEDVKKAGCNALVVYLGNFGPEISETLLAKHFDGPKMFVAAAEETQDNLTQGRGDAYCGMLNASYNLKLRGVKAYIPEYPVGTAEECADMIHEFEPIARAVVGLSDLKIISFGPRPLNFLACNAPIQQLYNIGVEIEENSELDLFEAYNKHEGDERIPAVVKEMEEELGAGNKKPEILPKLAQYEITLKDWVEEHRGYRKYVAIAGKCWPAFQTQFGFVPCYVNSRLTAQGIPVSCEVDIYGALSEFIGTAVSQDTVTLLDINNTVPADMYKESIEGKFPYTQKDTFMGFHCGNTASDKLSFCEMKYQKIMATAAIEFEGQTLNLYGVQKYFEHEDREVRRAAVRAYSDFYHSNEKRLEEIWEELITIRNQMGKNLGYANFIPVGYMQQGRTDYGEKEVAAFREQVRTELVPLCEQLYAAQAKRIVRITDGNIVYDGPVEGDKIVAAQERAGEEEDDA